MARNNTHPRVFPWIMAILFTAGLLFAIMPLVKYVVNWQAVMVEHNAVLRVVRSWEGRPPARVSERDWRIACEALGIAMKNTFMPFQVSLEDARSFRAEVEKRHKEPPTVETLEWFLRRLGETGAYAAEYISRLESWWQDELNPVRVQSGGPKLERILEELNNWYLRRPLKEECDAWADLMTSLRTAILRIYSRTDDATIGALSVLERELESLSAQPVTRDTLQRLTQHIGEATPHGAEYMARVEYFRDRFERLDRMSDEEEKDKRGDSREATGEPRAVVP